MKLDLCLVLYREISSNEDFNIRPETVNIATRRKHKEQKLHSTDLYSDFFYFTPEALLTKAKIDK